jgi:hypothetical protein
MARFSSRYADRHRGTIERVFTVLSDLATNRCEELNNYSEPMTRSKYDYSAFSAGGRWPRSTH